MSLTNWLKKLGEDNMPAFRKTAAEVTAAASDPSTGTERLGRLILQDPALTVRLLRLSNMAYYNPSGKPTSTISRAVMVLGVDTVRSICLSLSLMEALLDGSRQERVMLDLGRSLHAAMQAKALALAIKDPRAEEIFIAAFLRQVGNMVFWCFSKDEGVALDTMLKPGRSDALAEKAVLGFSLSQLSHALIEDWNLSPLLLEIFRGHRHTAPAECVLKGWEIARLAEKGWTEGQTKAFVAKLAARRKSDPSVVGAEVLKVAREARQAAQHFGSEICATAIPLPPLPRENDAALFAIEPQPESDFTASDIESELGSTQRINSDLLLGSFRELNDLASRGRLSSMFGVVLNAIHAGMGVDRAVFATVTPRTDVVVGRSAMGLQDPFAAESFQFTIRRQMADSLSRSMEQGAMVVNIGDPMKRPAVVPDSLLPFVKGSPFLFAPVHLGKRAIGAYYCDCQTSGRDISPEMVEVFQHLVQQLELLLSKAASQRSDSAAL